MLLLILSTNVLVLMTTPQDNDRSPCSPRADKTRHKTRQKADWIDTDSQCARARQLSWLDSLDQPIETHLEIRT